MSGNRTPGACGANQETTPLTPRSASVIRQVSNFIGIGSGSQDLRENTVERAKWDMKRLRRIANKYKVNKDEVTKFAHSSSINEAGPPGDMEIQRESVASAVFSSMSNFLKKGSLINKNRFKLNSSFASKCSFDPDVLYEPSPSPKCMDRSRNVARWVRWDKPDPIAAKRNFLSHKSLSDTDLLRGQNISNLSAKWKQKRRSGAVCGQDPSYCDYPSSVAPQEWPDDITQWPICEKTYEGVGLPEHVTCQVTGRPCCIQLQGLCRIATRQYCDFVRGHWHENATLCSQVNCFSSVCGMLPFFGNSPNQFYRLFISLFIHAGLIHLIATIALQWWMMTDLEQFIGSKRMAILYLFSGIGGNLASAIFVPFNPEVGPSGSQCGLLAANIVDFYHHRRFIKNHRFVFISHLLVTLLVFACGLIPYVDNWAHFFGFIFGILITIIFFPYLDSPEPELIVSEQVSFSSEAPMSGYSQLGNGFPSPEFFEPGINILQPIQIIWAVIRQRVGNTRTLYVIIASILLIVLFLGLAIIFFANIKIDCPWCIYFNCLPVFPCHNQGQKLKKWLPI